VKLNRNNGSAMEQTGYREMLNSKKIAVDILLVTGFTILTVASALVRIPLPFTPVPITLQTLVVLLAGATLGSVRGGLSQLLYIVWGAAGLPFFAGSAAGLAIITGPTGGYLFGFILGAIFMGLTIKRTKNLWVQTGLFTIGTMIILLTGWMHLSFTYLDGNLIKGLTLGVLPFIPGAVFKIAASAGIYRSYVVLSMKKNK
jgi:biotin transport system substrate-specific component